MLTFFVFDSIAALIGLYYLTETENLPSSVVGWVTSTVLAIPLMLLGFAKEFAAWLGLFWVFDNTRNIPYGVGLFLVQTPFLQNVVFMQSVFAGALSAALVVRHVASRREERRRTRR